MSVQTGADQLAAEQCARLRGQRVGLLTNPAGVTSELRSLVELLATAPGVELVALFGPEHGLDASAPAGAAVDEQLHPRYGVPIHSLYGSDEGSGPTAASLAGLDLLVVDLPDVGARFFTYLATLVQVLLACGRTGTPLLLLDRPNPLGGEIIEGPLLAPALRSFVGPLPIPIRHGMTLGELARFANAHENAGAALTVLPVQGWQRGMIHAATALPWVPPSPNMPTAATAAVYPGTCLVEGSTLSEGRGTTLPFEQIGAPWLNGDQLAADLNARQIPGLRWRPTVFTPTGGHDHVGLLCQGVQLHPYDLTALRPVTAALHLLAAARAQNATAFGWHAPAAGHLRHIDRLAGTTAIAVALDASAAIAELVASWEPDLARFRTTRQEFLLS